MIQAVNQSCLYGWKRVWLLTRQSVVPLYFRCYCISNWLQYAPKINSNMYTVKPVLSGYPVLSGQYPNSPNLFHLFTLNETCIKRTPPLTIGTTINWSTLTKKVMQTYIIIVSLGEYSERFHCSFEWHLTSHMTLSIETCIRRTSCIKRTPQHSPRVSA